LKIKLGKLEIPLSSCGFHIQSLHSSMSEWYLSKNISLHIVPCRAVSRQQLGKHVPEVTDTHATVEVLLETVFSTRSV
jgi:hypothetical protein